jgi:hypothetical protein
MVISDLILITLAIISLIYTPFRASHVYITCVPEYFIVNYVVQ